MSRFNLSRRIVQWSGIAGLFAILTVSSAFAGPQDGKKGDDPHSGHLPQGVSKEVLTVNANIDVKAAEPKQLQEMSDYVFGRLRKLEGTWVGSHPGFKESQPFEVRYETTGRGTVVVETFRPGLKNETRTHYIRTERGLRVQHLCAFGTQPEMLLFGTANDGALFVFTEAGGSNLAFRGDETRRMRLDTMEFQSDDKIVAVWSTFEGDKALGPPTAVHLQRKGGAKASE